VGIRRLQPVVVVDEAHLLDWEMLEELRFRLNLRMDSQNPLVLIFWWGKANCETGWGCKRTQRFASELVCIVIFRY